jgi:cell division protein FtsW
MVYSASSYVAAYRYHNQYYFLIKQIIGAVIGIGALITCSLIDYHKYIKIRWILVIVSIVLLILVFIPGIGVSNYGANRWIDMPGFTVQPSEIAKFVFVIFSAYYLANNYHRIKTFKGFLPVVLLGGIYATLVILEPNMSITMCLVMLLIIMLFVGGVSFKQFLFIILPALVLVQVLIIIEPYRLKRLVAFIDPWATPQAEGFQLIQSLYSIGSGGWFGVGLFNSRQKYLFLPFSESDFIFSIIAEEFGFVGAAVLILFFCSLIFVIVKIGLSAKDRFGSLLAIGIASVIAVQVIINIAVVTGTIPPTGLPLPFISAGSSSLIVFMAAIGICINISRKSREIVI